MPFGERIKSALEWLGHGKDVAETVVIVLAALGGTSVVRAWLVQHALISGVWVTPLWLLSSAVLAWVLFRFVPPLLSARNKNTEQTEAQKPQSQIATVENPINLQAVNDFYRTYDNSLLVESEDNFRRLFSGFPEDERINIAVRLLSSGVIAYTFDIVWYTIYASQINALHELNRHPLRRDEVKPYYDSAAAEFPKIYEQYPFDKWFGYLRTWVLIREDGDVVSLTVRGQEFLKYLIQQCRSVHDRTF